MGDRANIYLIDNDDTTDGIYLYTHWNGYEWPERLRQALEFGRDRWSDPTYLARIITSKVFAELENSTTGGGLSTMLTDNEYDIIVVNLLTQRVAFAPPGKEGDPGTWSNVQTFEEFVNNKSAEWPR